jgi:cytidine deaminase
MLLASARELTDDDRELVELARATIDANTDADPDRPGIYTMGRPCAPRTVACSSV